MTNQNAEQNRCGFVSVIGLPNAGKSTLVNALVGAKVSIVSRKVQTTRARLLGMAIKGDTQIVLIDTPGIFTPKKKLEQAMVDAALSSFDDADFIVHLIDASQKNAIENNRKIIEGLEGRNNVVLALNKIDRVAKPDLLALTQTLNDTFPYKDTFMISALDGRGIDDLGQYFAERLPEGPWLFPEDQISNAPLRLMAAEITREKIFDRLHQELPYAIFVETEDWEQFDNGSVKIMQIVYVNRENQKGIVLGKGGSRIKTIGEAARAEIEELIGTRVHLKIFVKVQENWAERTENYRLIGLE